MANVIDVSTNRPLGGAKPTMLLDWGGVRLGLMGELAVDCLADVQVGTGNSLLLQPQSKLSRKGGQTSPTALATRSPAAVRCHQSCRARHVCPAGLVVQEWLTTLAAVDPAPMHGQLTCRLPAPLLMACRAGGAGVADHAGSG